MTWGSYGPVGHPAGFHGTPPPGPPPGQPGPWEASEAISFGWDRVKADFGNTVGALFVAGFLSGIVSGIGSGIAVLIEQGHLGVGDPKLVATVVRGISAVLNLFPQSFLQGGITLFALNVARGSRYAF